MQSCIKAIILSIPLAFIGWAAQNSAISTAAPSALCQPISNHRASLTQSVKASNLRTEYSSSNESLNRLQNFFLLTLKTTEKHFQGRQGLVTGFGAGSAYPQIWLRDSATVIPVARYYYPAEYLTAWLEEHLSFQRSDGSLNDWIASGGASNFLPGAPRAKEIYRVRNRAGNGEIIISADKNTTEADQETSAVDAAYQIFRITGDLQWLRKDIKGDAIVNRLDRSLEYLLKARFDSSHGLLSNAFTADWGDVSPIYNDQRAIYLDDKTPLVAALYTNVLFYRAAGQMQEIHRALGQTNRAAYWRKEAATIKANVNKYLWQEDKGFYRAHVLLTPALARDSPDDSNIFAMGGNGLAVLCSVADDAQSARIFEVAGRRQREFGFSTVAGVLFPSYPKGFFKHPAVNEEYFYQNGGQWDWFAGRFLLAEFERGYSARAYQQLAGIANKAVANNGLYEWHTRDGKGMGSSDYVGSAGSLGGAIFQGLYGVYLSEKDLNLKIRLRDQPGQVHLFEPATGKYVSYQYRYLEDSRTLKLTYESNSPRIGNVCLLVPKNREPLELTVDGEKKIFKIMVTGEDTYGCFSTNWKAHQLELKISDSQSARYKQASSLPVLRRQL
jgi:hypothetical protein